jgi:hypothetical protein
MEGDLEVQIQLARTLSVLIHCSRPLLRTSALQARASGRSHSGARLLKGPPAVRLLSALTKTLEGLCVCLVHVPARALAQAEGWTNRIDGSCTISIDMCASTHTHKRTYIHQPPPPPPRPPPHIYKQSKREP